MKRFLHLVCSVCKRSVDKLVDNTHVTPDRCTITLRCTGRLFPVEYRSNAAIATAPVAGLQDWRPRGTAINTVAEAAAEPFSITSGDVNGFKQLVVAVKTTATLTTSSVATLKLYRQIETTAAFSQFIYRRDTAFSSIEGVESGLEKKTLSYNAATQDVEVFLNGVKLARGTGASDYMLYPDGGIPNSIKFNTPITLPGITQVDVFVKAATVSQTPTTIALHRNHVDTSRTGAGAWENVDSIRYFVNGAWQTYYLFTADIGSASATLTLNSNYTVDPTLTLNYNNSIVSTDTLILLSHPPYSQLDRYMAHVVRLASFGDNLLSYKLDNGSAVLTAPTTTIAKVFPVLRPTYLEAEGLLTTDPGIAEAQVQLDNDIVIGPDR